MNPEGTIVDVLVDCEPDDVVDSEPEVADEVLVEEVSIDGMCGVY